MPLPGDVTTVTVTGKEADGAGAPYRGTVTWTPSGPLADASDGLMIEPIPIVAVLDVTGAWSITVPCTDATALNPSGWTWTVAFALSSTYGGPVVYSHSWTVSVPSSLSPGPVKWTAIAPAVPAPTSPGGVTISGTPTTGQVIVATSSTTADWQTPPAGVPSGTVVSETGYGQGSAAGSATTYSRGDHTHGSPSLSSTPPTTSAVGDTAAFGSASVPARGDHTHGREAFGAVTAQTSFGLSSANGIATSLARSDHTHGTPSLSSAGYVGAWSSATTYSAGQLVTEGTALFGAVAGSTNSPPIVVTDLLTGTPATVDAGDPGGNELGIQCSVSSPVRMTVIKFYKAAANTGSHFGRVWELGNGGTFHKVNEVEFTGETSSGVQSMPLTYDLLPGRTYIISVAMPGGHYSTNTGYFTSPVTVGSLTVPASGSLFNSTVGNVPNTTSTTAYWVWPEWQEIDSAHWTQAAWYQPLPPYLT